jgi:hypothetical protein
MSGRGHRHRSPDFRSIFGRLPLPSARRLKEHTALAFRLSIPFGVASLLASLLPPGHPVLAFQAALDRAL